MITIRRPSLSGASLPALMRALQDLADDVSRAFRNVPPIQVVKMKWRADGEERSVRVDSVPAAVFANVRDQTGDAVASLAVLTGSKVYGSESFASVYLSGLTTGTEYDVTLVIVGEVG